MVVRKFFFGLTGNIGSGKSTVAKMLAEWPDVAVYDGDTMAKEIMARPGNAKRIQKILDDDVLLDGKLDFKAMGKIVFNDTTKLRALENFVHPLVFDEFKERARKSIALMNIFEAAIIYESRKENEFDAMIVVHCEEEVAIARAIARDRCKTSDREIRKRAALQTPSQDKMNMADFYIDSNCDMEHLRDRTTWLYKQLVEFCNGQ